MENIEKSTVLNKIKSKIAKVHEKYENSTLSVYIQGPNKKKRPSHFGSAFILKHEEFKYIVTARHLTENVAEGDELYFLTKLGAFFSLNSVKSEDDFEIIDADIDYHVIRIENELLDIPAILCNEESVESPYDLTLSIGYPISKNKTRVDRENRKAGMTTLRLTLTEMPSNEDLLLPKFIDHFALPWEDQLDEDFQPIQSIEIQGMSGGPCLYVPFSTKDIVEDVDPFEGVKLIGLLIEKHDDFVKYVRINTILKHISSKNQTSKKFEKLRNEV